MNFDFLGKYVGMFLQGASITIQVSLVSLVIGFIVGLLICLMKMSKVKILKWISTAYVEILRGTPLFVQVYIVYFGLAQFGIDFPDIGPIPGKFLAGTFALSINSSAYIAEIFRSGIQAVDKGQSEASRSLGLDYTSTMRYVIVPQAVKNILPALANEFITLVKESAILSVIGVQDLMFKSIAVKNQTYIAFEPFIVAAAMYFVMTFTLSKLVGILEKKLAKSN